MELGDWKDWGRPLEVICQVCGGIFFIFLHFFTVAN